MAHNTSGLPKLDLEPFDPSALYAAARSPEREKDLARRGPDRRRRLVGIVLALAVVAVAAGAGAWALI
ncbi:hypothetical protein GCM10023168_15760 [Fodinibacter luteus]|uniref:Uncharacterized protein n=1 Tax=Fodinibacter luteus TaxID=552064 RepID=A0ABP8KCV4_9MICO